MAFIDSVALFEAVKTTLVALALDPLADPAGEKLFDAFAFYNVRDPVKALNDLFLTQEQRVGFLAPGGDNHQNSGGRDLVNVVSHCESDFEIMLCDRVWEKGNTAAVLGGPENLGLIRMKDRVRAALMGQSLGISGVVLLPGEGGLVDLFDPRGEDIGRTVWVQSWSTYAGREKVSVE